MVYTGIDGKQYDLLAKPLASGGEGEVYNVNGNPRIVAKLYKPDRISTEKERKLKKMAGHNLDQNMLTQIAWPQDVIYDSNRQFAGFVMPKMSVSEDLNVVYEYGSASKHPDMSWEKRIIIAENLCAVLDSIHNSGHVCGDLNPKNISVNPNTGFIVFLDVDSFHIKDGSTTYRCDVGIPEYLPKEIQEKMRGGNTLTTAALPTFSQDTDNFALAIHIFQLLMNGVHPFACSVIPSQSSVTAPQPADNIIKGQIPFLQNIPGVTIPVYAPKTTILPQKIQSLFKRAFIDGHSSPNKRPKPEEWHTALRELRRSLRKCDKVSCHQYYKSLMSCPWCEADESYNQLLGRPRIKTPPKPTVTAPPRSAVPPPPAQSKPQPRATPQPDAKSSSSKRRIWFPFAIILVCVLVLFVYAIPAMFKQPSAPVTSEQKPEIKREDKVTANEKTVGEQDVGDVAAPDEDTVIVIDNSIKLSDDSSIERIHMADGWLYYTNSSDGATLYKIRPDGNDRTKLNDEFSFYIYSEDDWVYYQNLDDSDAWVEMGLVGEANALYRMRTDGSEKAKLNDCSSNIKVVDGWVYYISWDDDSDGGNLYRVRTNGSNMTKLDGDSECILVADGWIYYYSRAEDRHFYMYKIRLDGSDKTMLSKEWGSPINVADGWLYYSYDDLKLCKIRLDGSDRTELNNDRSNDVKVIGDCIYYVNWSENGNLYKINTEGSGRTKLNNDNCWNITIVDDWIFYRTNDDNYELYKVRTDGSGRTKLTNNQCLYFVVSDGWVYYTNRSDGYKLYKLPADENGMDNLAYESETSASVQEYLDDLEYYPDAFSEVPVLDLGLDWVVEMLSDYDRVKTAGRRYRLDMQIRYDAKNINDDIYELAERYFILLEAAGFAFDRSGEHWGVTRMCDYFSYKKDDIHVYVEVFDGSNELYGIIIRLETDARKE